LNDVTYAFRHDSTGTQINVYKSGGVFGWEAVPFLKTISFTGGKTLPSEGDRIKQGAVTATIRRIVRNSGSWQYGDAAGQFIIDTLAGGNFIAGAADMVEPSPSPTVVGTCTLAGAQTDISLTAHTSSTTKFEFAEYDFLAGTSTNRVYGCDGVNRAFEFDGEILVPLVTGPAGTAEGDGKPTHVCCHKGYLFLSIGAFFMHSAPGLPYCWDALENAGRLDIGGEVTNMITMPGGTNTATMGITSRTNTYILYGGGVSDWSLVPYNTGTGGRPWTAQNMSQTYLFDDRGVQSLQTTLQYGNFAQSVLTNQVLTFINERINKVTCATLCRRKNQYRVFFDDGYALFITIVNGKLLGCMPVYFPDPVFCVYEGKRSTGEDVIFFGSTNGYVYQMEKGTSFDGDAIDFNLVMNYSNAKSPRTLKRYRKCIPELSAASGTYAEFDFSYILGYDSAEYDQDLSKSYNRYGGNVRWDSFTWDNTFWDVKNTNMVECEMDGTAENVAVMVSGSSDYVPEFTVNSFLIHYSPRRMMR
jgi:hypothetical protein